MAEQKESSVLFSLKELMNLEEDRIKQEESTRKAKHEAEVQARLDAERRVREEEEARQRAEDERRRVDDQRTREEDARVEAIRHAEVEKARMDAENAARLEQMRHQQEHERHLQTIKQDKHKKHLMMAAVGASLLLVVGGIGAAMAIKSSNDRAAQEQAQHAKDLAETQAKNDALQKQLDEQTQNINNLVTQLSTAKDDATRAYVQKQIEDAQSARAATAKRLSAARNTGGGGGGGGGTTAPKPRPACTCQSGDPLCSCIQ